MRRKPFITMTFSGDTMEEIEAQIESALGKKFGPTIIGEQIVFDGIDGNTQMVPWVKAYREHNDAWKRQITGDPLTYITLKEAKNRWDGLHKANYNPYTGIQ